MVIWITWKIQSPQNTGKGELQNMKNFKHFACEGVTVEKQANLCQLPCGNFSYTCIQPEKNLGANVI